MTRVEVAAPLRLALGESPVWDVEHRVLYCVDILEHRIHRLDPARGAASSVAVAAPPGALALRDDGGFVAGLGLDLATLEADGTATTIARAPVGDRVNDGTCDARGRFVAGTMDAQERVGRAALYQLHADGALVALRRDVALSNGLDWNAVGDTLYHVDTATRRIDAFEYDLETGRLGAQRPFADLHDAGGRPDGLTVDAEDGVWVAVARAGEVRRYDAAGRLDAVVRFPASRVTSCAFGGPDLDALYVTSSRALVPEAERAREPLAGAVFVVEGLGVRGRAPNRFRARAASGAALHSRESTP